MKVFLMFADTDFDAERTARPGDDDLVDDLELTTLWAAAAGPDGVVLASVRTAMLEGLIDPDQIDYRQDVLADCLRHADVVRELYGLAVDAVVAQKKIYRASFFSRSSAALLNRSVAAMKIFSESLQHLRAVADEHGDAFGSRGFVRFFAAVRRELDDDYLGEVSRQLHTLQFQDGLLASASLGLNNEGVGYVLRTPRPENRGNFVLRRPPVKRPAYSRTIPHGDEAGHQELGALRDRILGLAADSVAQSAEHVLDFFTALRTELAFYVGCLNLHEQLSARGQRVCRTTPRPLGSTARTACELYDPCLALQTPNRVYGTDLSAEGVRLIFVTGANQGGKTTLLRAVGLAQLMMQAGMFVAATSFAASTVDGVFTHYRREEDRSMVMGKLEEELHRMSEIAQHVRPHSLLLCNESFAATNEREGAEIAAEVVRALNYVGVTVVFVTHLYEFSHRVYEEAPGSAVFLRADGDHADLDSSEGRPFLIREGEPLPTSHGPDLYRATFRVPAASRR